MVDGIMSKDDGKSDKSYQSEMHRKQRTKNLALMAVLVGFCVLVYFVAIIRMSGGS